MTTSQIKTYDLPSDIVPGPVPVAVLLPPGYEEASEPLPLCLSLHGGGSSRDDVIAAQPLFEDLWQQGALEPMVVATASTGFLSWYLNEPGGAQWETFIADEFLSHLTDQYHVRTDRDGTVMTGISMGGLGTLKIGFAHPERYLAIAAMEAGIEPGFTRDQSPLRSRVYIAAAAGTDDTTMDRLLGPEADAVLFEANAPAVRLRDNAHAIKASGMSIYLECGDYDALNLHDGNEFLHRLLWDLDISHEYHLVKDADHLGPSIGPRMIEAFTFLSKALLATRKPEPSQDLSAEGQAWLEWSKAGMTGPAPAFDMESDEGALILRELLKEARQEIVERDPTITRRFAVLPPTS
jgi:S-formylglutathione hydrolase